ncbi:MAG: hypothetical protein EBS06_05045 [Proteobacteria bacterium]|nr:hypothetical protein [Pseudomonadota bacterium]
MDIESVKKSKNGYLVNELIFIPLDEKNSDYKAVQKWIVEGGIVEPEFSLNEIKNKKIAEIKSIRDQKNIAPLTDYKAFLIDDEGNKIAQESYFLFYTNRHQLNPASDPESIISRTIELGSMPYFTKNLEGKKITIELTAEIASLLKQRIFERNNNNHKVSGVVEEAINNAKSIEELEAIQLEE